MEKRKLEKPGIETSLLGFGCMRFPVTADGKIDEPEAERMLDKAIAAGVNYIDTAYPYHDGASEPFVGRALKKYDRHSFYLATKLPCWKVEKLEDVDPETARMLQEQLTLHYFTPIIEKVNRIKDEYGFAYWDVVTNHGACRFTIRMGGNSVIHLSESRILIMDIDENRFEIPDVNKLTPKERKKLDLFI